MKIVVIEGYSLNPGDLSWDGLEALGELTVYDRSRQDQIVERCKDAEMVFTNKEPIGRDIMAQLPKLKFIGVLATGYNCVDVAAAKELGIVVSNVPGYGTTSVVQLTFALLLELTLHVQDHSNAVKNGDWSKSPDFCFWNFPLIELAGKTMGIIGFGDIGKKVADVASAFGMKIIANSRTRTDQTHHTNFRWASVEELLAESDVVSLHCPLTPETNGLINWGNLMRMKSSAFLINTSRGPLVIDQDLADALNDGVIAGAGIDVLSKEPPPTDNPLFSAKNCIITPHIAWATKEARIRLMDIVVTNARAYIDGKLVNVVSN
jgi:glycerate dehydrogenase